MERAQDGIPAEEKNEAEFRRRTAHGGWAAGLSWSGPETEFPPKTDRTYIGYVIRPARKKLVRNRRRSDFGRP